MNTRTDPTPSQEILKQRGISIESISGFQPSFVPYQNRPAMILITGKDTRRRVIFLAICQSSSPLARWRETLKR